MKTLKIISLFCLLIGSWTIHANAQTLQYKDLPMMTFCGWVDCANNGEGEELCGTLYVHLVIHTDKNGNPDWFHANYDKSIFVGTESGEVFTLFGGSNYGAHPHSPFQSNEIQQLRGDKGTKAVLRWKWHFTPEGEFVMDLTFEKCK